MAISKVILNGVTQMDVTDTTATAADVASGKVFYMASGLRTVGTASGGLTDDVKTALLNCFEHVAWIDDQGQTYYDELYNALHDGLDSISAVYTQTGTVYTTDSLDILRSDLVVTATYVDGTTRTVTAYTLSGTLAVGTSTVTVDYFSTTATFTVTVTDPAYITAVFTQPQTTIYTDDSLDSLKSYLVVTYYTAPGATGTVLADSAYTLSGTLTEGTSVITAGYQGLTDTFNVANVVDLRNIHSWNFPSDVLMQTTYGVWENINGTLGISKATTRRSIYLTKGKHSCVWTGGTLPNDAYPIPIPSDATSGSITISNSLYFASTVWRYNESTGNYTTVSGTSTGWVQNSGTVNIPSGEEQYLIISYRKSNNTDMSTTASDPSSLSLVFS